MSIHIFMYVPTIFLFYYFSTIFEWGITLAIGFNDDLERLGGGFDEVEAETGLVQT
jgi:hypothetical protein